MKKWSKFGLIIAFIWLSGCSTTNSFDEVTINISAASSLQESLSEITTLFIEQNPSVGINLNFAGSNTLQRQISEGFAVDVFLSAHQDPVAALEEEGFVKQHCVFVQNEVVLVASTDEIQSLEDLKKDDMGLILASEAVPIGIYSRQVLDLMDLAQPGFKEAVMANVISQGENVRQVLMKVMLKEGDAAFVYRTDITPTALESVHVIDLPETYQVVSDFYLALIKRDEIKQEAELFFDFIFSHEAQEVFKSHGFKINSSDSDYVGFSVSDEERG